MKTYDKPKVEIMNLFNKIDCLVASAEQEKNVPNNWFDDPWIGGV